MESVLEEARAQSNPVGLPLHHCLSRDQQNNEGKSLGAKNVESAIEEAGAINSSVVLSLHQGLSRDQENNIDKSSVLTNTNVDAVVRENGKYDVYENSDKKIECEGEDTLGKPGSDKETSMSFMVKVDDKKERENGLSSEHDCEIENNKITGDHHSAREADIVDESEDHDVTRNTICGSGGKKMETCSDETEKIRSSEGKFVHSSHTNGVHRSKCDMQVGEGISHEKEQEYDENGCRTEQVGHNESEYPGNKSSCGDGKLKEKIINNAGDSEDKSLLNNDSERLTEDEKESEGIICSKEVVVKRSENEDSEIICNGDVLMDRSRIRDYNDKNAVGKDGNKLIKDTEESEGVSSSDEEMVKINEILDSESNNSMHDADKSIENSEEIEEQNFNPESMPANHVKEMEADMSQKERKSKKSIIEVIEEERGEMNLDMTERKEMTDVDVREVKENKMDLEILKGEEIGVEMVEEKERDIERTQRKEKGVEMAEGKKRNVEIAEEIGVDTERMEGKEKERDADIAEGKEMSGEMSQETVEMDVEMKEEKEKQLECKEAEGGGTGGEGVDEEREKSQACKPESCIMEVSLAQTFNYKKKEKREKQEECTEKIYIPLEKETTQKTADEDVTELTKESKQDKLEEKTGSKESEANEEVGKRSGEYDASNLNRASSDHTKQNEPEIQEVEKSNSGQSNEERETLNQQEEVQQNTLTSQVTKQSNHLLRSECISLEVSPRGVNQSLRGEEVTVKAGQCGEKNDSGEMRCKGIGSVTPTYEKEQSSLNVGNAFCSTSEILSGKKSIAKKSTSKVSCGSPQRSKDQSIDLEKMNERKQHRRKRVKAFAGPDTETSSPLQHPSAKEVPNSSMAGQKNGRSTMVPGIVRMERSKPGAVYLYTGHPGGSLAPLPLSTVPQPSMQTEEVLESDDSDIEIISEKIVSRNVSMPVKKPHLVCDACQIIWNNDVLEAIFEGNKAVTVNSKITYGAILCFNYYVETHHWQDKEQTLRNVLERADLGKNIGTLKMTEVIKLLSRMMRDGSVKCCDVFDAVYNATNVSNLLSLLNSDSEDASELASWQQNIQKPVEETNKRRTSNSSRVNSLENGSSGTSKVTTLQNASSKVPEPENVRKASKSTETQVKSNESPIISGDVLKGAKATRKNSNVQAPKAPLKDTCSGSDEIPVTHEKICLKECTVYLGKRVQVPQQKVCVQSVSSSPTISKRKSSFEDVSMEVSCKKKGIISGLPMSDKESTDTEGSIKSKDEKEAVEQTSSKESTTVACPPTKESTALACSLASKRKQCLEKEVDKELPLIKNGRIPGLPLSAKESTDTQDSFNFEDTDLVEQTASKKSTTEVFNQSFDNDESKMTTVKDKCKEKTKEEGMIKLDTVDNEKSTHDLSYDRDASSLPMELSDEKSTSESENKINESDKETSEKDTVGVQKDLEKIMPQAKRHDNRNCQILSNTEKVKETSIMQMEDKTKRVKQDVPTDMMASSRQPKQKKRPSIDPTSQSSKKRRTLNEVEGELPDENLSMCLLDDHGKLSPINCKKKKSKTKHLTSTDSGHSEDLLLYLENSSDSSSDEPPQSCESSDEVDFKGSGKRLVSPIERTRSEKSLKSPKALRRRSQRVPSVKKVVTSSESSSDNCDQQLTYSGDLTPPSRKSMDGKLGPLSENNEESTNILIQQLGLNVSGINLYCSVTDTRIFTNGDMANNSSEREKSIPALEIMLKERSNLDGVAREAFDLLPFEPNNFSFTGNNGSRERYLTNQELLVLQNICVLNPENPDVDMFYQILIQILLARKRVLLVPNSLSLLLVAEGIRREFNRAKRKGSYVLYLSQDWDTNKIYTAEDFWLGNKRPPNVPSVCTVLSMFCLWKNLEKRVPISFPIALEELCRNLVLLDVDKIGICVKLYSRYCTFLYEEKNPSLAEFFLKQPFLGSQTELKKKNLLCMMEENSKQTSGKSSTNHSFNVTENDVQRLMKKCMEAEQAALRSSSPRDEENFRKCVQALKYKIDAYKKEIHQIQKVTKETQKKKLQLLSKLSSPQFKDCTKGLSKTVETLYRVLSKRTTKFEMIREVESMSVKETNRISRPPLVVLKGTDLGEDISESMKELVYDLLINEVKMEEVRPVLCVIVQNLSDKDLSVVPTDSWIRNFARVAGLKVRRSSNLLRW